VAQFFRVRASATLAVALVAANATPVFAAQRTFVGPSGSNSNPCTLAQPCRSFDIAIAATDPGGEVIVLDSAGYGPTTITKEVSIISPPGVYAGISVAAGAGVTINTTTGKVVLRGLTINGIGGSDGVDVQSAAEVHVEGVVISNMASDGVHSFSDNAQIFIRDSIIRDNDIGVNLRAALWASLDGVRIERNPGGGLFLDAGAHADARNVVLERNNFAVFVHNVGPASTTTELTLTNAMIARNNAGIVVFCVVPGSTARLTMTQTTIADNAGDGVQVIAQNSGATEALLFDAFGIAQADASASVVTRGDNVLIGNNGGGA
jgi:hypothetical protein